MKCRAIANNFSEFINETHHFYLPNLDRLKTDNINGFIGFGITLPITRHHFSITTDQLSAINLYDQFVCC
jgi:hypothetical protein